MESASEKSGMGRLDGQARSASENEWHSISLEDLSRSKVDCSFQRIGEHTIFQQERKYDATRENFSKPFNGGGDGSVAEKEALVGIPSDNQVDGLAVGLEASDIPGGGKEVRLTFHGLEAPTSSGSEKLLQKPGLKQSYCESRGLLGCGDKGCLPLLPQVRAFIKGAKFSLGGLFSGDSRMLDGWSSVLQRSFSMRQSDSSASESELFCKESKGLMRTVSTPLPVTTTSLSKSTGGPNVPRGGFMLAPDPQSRADALPLAHYRPIDGTSSWKEEGRLPGQSTSPVPACKSPTNMNCKKPPKPPRHPGRTASLDSATAAAQRASKKCRDKVSSKRKMRSTTPVAGTGVTPLVALVLTIGFGILMVFQGVFVQTNASYGRDANNAYVDPALNLRSSILAHRSVLDRQPHHIDQAASELSHTEVSKSEAILSNAFHKSMEELAWSRRSLALPTQ